MYRDNLWVMGQYSGHRTAEETNRRLKGLIDKGQSGFSIAMDLPTQLGLDSDHPLATGEVGKVGAAIYFSIIASTAFMWLASPRKVRKVSPLST